jgi:hypothetical protein
VLAAYADAYSRRDAGAVKRLYPAANEPALRDTFSKMRSQQVQIRDEKITITGPTSAAVSLTWFINIVPEVGVLQRGAPKVTLRLQKSGNTWIIVERQ